MTGGEFRVRTAALWLKADYKAVEKKKRPKCRHTEIYVFKIISDRLPESVTLSNSVSIPFSPNDSHQVSTCVCLCVSAIR